MIEGLKLTLIVRPSYWLGDKRITPYEVFRSNSINYPIGTYIHDLSEIAGENGILPDGVKIIGMGK